MNVWIHTAILATTLVAALAVGIASASPQFTPRSETNLAAKADRLPVDVTVDGYVTIETRGERLSNLRRVPID